MTSRAGESRYYSAIELERALGDPRDSAEPCGYAAMVERDRTASLPSALLERCGESLRVGLLPRESGGLDIDQLIVLLRVVARRDLAVIPAALFSITSLVCVELAGDDKQRERVRNAVARGESIGFALSEPDHGSDLLSNTTSLTRDTSHWLLNGTKWLVGMGEGSSTLLVVAHTGGRGPGSYTTLLTRAKATETDSASGFRGIPLGRYEFCEHPVYDEDVVGIPGRGLETAMKAMSLVRIVSTSANLAAMDTALRLAFTFAYKHKVRGVPIGETKQSRRELGTALAANNAADVVAMVSARSLHAVPEAASLFGGIAKVVVPALSDVVVNRLGDLIGSRSIMSTGGLAAFDVVRRDNGVVRYIDTSPGAAIRQIIPQIRQIRASSESEGQSSASDILVDLGGPLEPFNPSATELVCRGRDHIWERAKSIWSLNDHQERQSHHLEVDRLRPMFERASVLRGAALGRIEGEDSFAAAQSFCFVHAALTCLVTALGAEGEVFFGDSSSRWVWGTVELLLDRAEYKDVLVSPNEAEHSFGIGEALWRNGSSFSALPIPLSESMSTIFPKGEQ